MKKAVGTIIVSDVHLGFGFSRPEELTKALKKYRFKRLILNGDIFEDLNFNRLHSEHWDLLSHLRRLTKTVDVVWIVGNHDGRATVMSKLLGIEVHNQYVWKEGGKKFLAIHGHQFDRFVSMNSLLSHIASFLYYSLRILEKKHSRLTEWIRRNNRGWLRLSNEVASGAARYAKLYRADIVICGHTHKPMSKRFGRTLYLNSGSWVEKPSTLITITNGKPEVIKFN